MAPELNALVGIDASGRAYEVALFVCVALVGAFFLWRERVGSARERGGRSVVFFGAVLVAGGVIMAVRSALGRLTFGEAGLPITTYGVAAAAGLSLTIFGTYREARRTDAAFEASAVLDMAFAGLVGGFVGARVLYLITDREAVEVICATRPLGCAGLLTFWDGGIVYLGGAVGAVVAIWAWCRRHDVAFAPVADLAAPWAALGHAVARLGCIGAGCCFGAPCDVPWAVRYPEGSPAQAAHVDAALVSDGAHSLPVHPAALYEAAGEWLLFALLMFALRPRTRRHGEVFAAWIVGYAALRSIVEVFRGDSVRGFVAEVRIAPVAEALGLAPDAPLALSTSQAVSLVVGAVATGWWWRTRRAGEGR